MYKKYIKRQLDVFFSALFILLFSPVYLVLAAAVFVNMGSPVIFTQERPGLKGKIFRLYKFRTMTDERDKEGNPLPDEQRLTGFGRFLRSTSMDELPELFNILKGDMSFVGPRPLLVKYLPYYTAQENKRHDVRPGLTGFAQVNGRDALSWKKRFRMDVFYVKHCGLMFDMGILLMTGIKTLMRSDILDGDAAAVQDFDVERKAEIENNG